MTLFVSLTIVRIILAFISSAVIALPISWLCPVSYPIAFAASWFIEIGIDIHSIGTCLQNDVRRK